MLALGHGRVVFIYTESGVSPAPEMAHNSATKTMQLGISRYFGKLIRGTEVTVNSVLPGSTRTENVEKFIQHVNFDLLLAEVERQFMSEDLATFLIGRLINPKDIGDIVAYLCSARASVIDDFCIRAEGGLVRSVF